MADDKAQPRRGRRRGVFLTSTDVAAIAGIGTVRLNRWVRKGFIVPDKAGEGPGNH